MNGREGFRRVDLGEAVGDHEAVFYVLGGILDAQRGKSPAHVDAIAQRFVAGMIETAVQTLFPEEEASDQLAGAGFRYC